MAKEETHKELLKIEGRRRKCLRNSGTDLGGNTNDVKSSYEKQTGNQSIIAV